MIRSKLVFKFYKTFIRYQSYSSNVHHRKRVCIVGSGPAGFYTASYLLKSGLAEVDFYEKLPTPFGLIRYGVAPDHTDIKNVTLSFSETAEHDLCKFYGNVNVGKDVSISELFKAYHAVVLAYGAQKDKILGIPGEDSKNVLSAKEFVSWYNGHPDYLNLNVNLDCDTALVIGHGNVALDVARILLQNIDLLKKTDISEHALQHLMKSRVKKVILAGRRGPLHIQFTIKELRAMFKLSHCDSIVHPEDFTYITKEFINSMQRPQKRIFELMHGAMNEENIQKHPKSWELKFYRKPEAVIADSQGRVEQFKFGVNQLRNLDLSQPSEIFDTGKEEIIPCGLVLKSVGYQSEKIDPAIPLDEIKHIVPNIKGKVINTEGLYCSGWIKTGPKGVILPTRNSSIETGETLVDDITKGNLNTSPCMRREEVLNLLQQRGVKYVTFEGWKKIDNVEKAKGQRVGKEREKLYTINDMLKAAEVS